MHLIVTIRRLFTKIQKSCSHTNGDNVQDPVFKKCFAAGLSLMGVFLALCCSPFFLSLASVFFWKVMSEAAKEEAKERFLRGDYMGAAKVKVYIFLRSTKNTCSAQAPPRPPPADRF